MGKQKTTLTFLDLIEIKGNLYTVYSLPSTRDRSKRNNSVITFQKRQDGFVYCVAAPTTDWLIGYLAGSYDNGLQAVGITQEQFSELGGTVTNRHGQYGPNLSDKFYIG